MSQISTIVCKFTPLGFETGYFSRHNGRPTSVNLPRWGLKPGHSTEILKITQSVNLPRWGLKQKIEVPVKDAQCECKFTPLGFETETGERASGNIGV